MANKNGLSPKDVLIKARTLIANRDNWLSGDLYDVLDGKECFCALGAIASANGYTSDDFDRLVDDVFYDDDDPAIQALAKSMHHYEDVAGAHVIFNYDEPASDVWIGNDRGGHDFVLKAFDRAIDTL